LQREPIITGHRNLDKRSMYCLYDKYTTTTHFAIAKIKIFGCVKTTHTLSIDRLLEM